MHHTELDTRIDLNVTQSCTVRAHSQDAWKFFDIINFGRMPIRMQSNS